MNERQPVGQKLRFEIFKRDLFTCQYCARKAPDVVLQVDHIEPVAKGGTSDPLNLITSCRECNGGKGATRIDDNSALERQRDQIEALEERRQQLEMMLRWREELSNLETDMLDAVCRHIEGRTGFQIYESGRASLRRWIKSYGVEEVIAASDEAFNTYLQYGVDDEPTEESWNTAFKKIPGIINVIRQSQTKPYLQRLFYIQGILRKRCRSKWMKCVEALESLVLDGLPVEEMEAIAKRSNSWEEFCRLAENALDDRTSGGPRHGEN